MKNHKESINYNAFLKYGLSFSWFKIKLQMEFQNRFLFADIKKY
jgi:hypothetical protein